MVNDQKIKMDLSIIKNSLICCHCRVEMEGYFKFLQSCHETEGKMDTYKAMEYPERCMQICEVKLEPPPIDEATEILGTEFVDIHNPIKSEFPTDGERINPFLYQYGDSSDHISCVCGTKDGSCLGCHAGSSHISPLTRDVKIEPLSCDTNVTTSVESGEFVMNDEVTLSESTQQQRNANKFLMCICDKKKKNCRKCKSQFELISTRPIMYKCQLCPYLGVWIKSHMSRHQGVSELQDISDSHESKTEITMYNCTVCEFKTKHRNSLKRHSLMHKTEAEITMYQCTECDFKTKHKNSFKCHSLTHKTEAEAKMYKCTDCDFETIRKESLKIHSLTHKTEDELTMYRCTVCDFKTIRKKYLKSHSLTHKPEAEIKMYQCTTCDFKTKHKANLTSHLLTHKSEAELEVYKCTECKFKTIRKNSLKRHSLTHRTEAELPMHKCTECDFQTIHKNNLKGHSMIHKAKAK